MASLLRASPALMAPRQAMNCRVCSCTAWGEAALFKGDKASTASTTTASRSARDRKAGTAVMRKLAPPKSESSRPAWAKTARCSRTQSAWVAGTSTTLGNSRVWRAAEGSLAFRDS